MIDQAAVATVSNFGRPMADEPVRTRILSDAEIKTIWNSLVGLTYTAAMFFRLAFRTGQRREEVLQATFSQFDLEAGIWRLPVKGGKEHWLGLPTQAVQEIKLAQATAQGSPWVCASRVNGGHFVGIQKALGKLRSISGVDFRPHDIRRTVATKMGDMNVPADHVSMVLSHRRTTGETVTNRVYNLSRLVGPTRFALQSWNDMLDEIVEVKWMHGDC